MPRIYEGDYLAQGLSIALVVSRFNDLITNKLVEGALDALKRHGGDPDKAAIAYVPGSVELAQAALKLAKTSKYDAVICLGCIIRGSTDHYDHVAQQASRGISEVGLSTQVPTIFGVITADTLEHAIERAGTKQGNAGAKAMLSAIELANLFKSMDD